MKKLSVKFVSNGIVIGNFNYKVIQNGRVLVEDSLSGRLSSSFTRVYEVSAEDTPVEVVFQNGNIPILNVTASLS